MDSQKDSYIKNILKKDDLISKKANDVFDNFLKGEMNNMKDVNKNVVDFNATKDKKPISIFRKRILATAASIMVIFLSANVYAVTKGYDNVFFMIKDMVTNNKEITDKKEILSDSDLTISYDFINISDDLRLQIKKLITKDNVGELYIDVRGNGEIELPKKYVVYDITNNDKKEVGKLEYNKETNSNDAQFDDKIRLNSITDNTKKLQLEVKDYDDNNIAVLNIDLNNKEIQVINSQASQNHLEKLSEVELKKFLGKYANFNYYKDYLNQLDGNSDNIINEIKVGVAMDIYSESYYNKYPNTQDIPLYETQKIHKIIKEMLGEDITEPITEFNGEISYNKENDEYELNYDDGLYSEKLCIEISDIKYQNGIYTVTFIYTYESEDAISIAEMSSDLELFKTTMKIKLNDNYEYTKYCVVDMDWKSEDSEKISGDSNEILNQNNSNNEVSIITDENVKDLSEMTIICPDGWGFENLENSDDKDISAKTRGQILDNSDNSVDSEITIYKSTFIGKNEMSYIEEIEKNTDCQYNGSFLTQNGEDEWTQLTRYPKDDSDNTRYDIYLHFRILNDGQILCHRIDMESIGNISELTIDIEKTAIDFIDNLDIFYK